MQIQSVLDLRRISSNNNKGRCPMPIDSRSSTLDREVLTQHLHPHLRAILQGRVYETSQVGITHLH
jgi:hypothetical protein